MARIRELVSGATFFGRSTQARLIADPAQASREHQERPKYRAVLPLAGLVLIDESL